MEEAMRKTITALAALGIVAAFATAVPSSAQAEWYGGGYHNGWRGHEWREHSWRGYGWRAHHWYPRYYSYYGYGGY
jgi:hypothetical protein